MHYYINQNKDIESHDSALIDYHVCYPLDEQSFRPKENHEIISECYVNFQGPTNLYYVVVKTNNFKLNDLLKDLPRKFQRDDLRIEIETV